MEAWTRGRPTVGQRAELSRTVSDRDIGLFTEISGDRNPLHYDESLAARSQFGQIIVQGGIITAILNAVVAQELPGPGTVFLHVDWSFRAPVRPGDVITGAVKVLEVREDKPITKLSTTVTRDDGVLSVEGTALCYTAPLG
jgi:acyl dehydratase